MRTRRNDPALLALALSLLAAAGCDDGGSTTNTGGAGSTSTQTTATTSSDAASGSTTASSSGSGMMPGTGLFYADGSRLAANVADFGGGATQFLSWHDAMLDLDCSFQAFTTGDVACVPLSGDASTYFADAGCTEPLMALFDPGGCVQTKYATIAGAPASCDTPNAAGLPGSAAFTGVRAVDAKFSGGTVYTKSGASCVGGASPPGVDLYETGAVVPLSTFVRATPTKEPRGPILFEDVLNGEDGSYQIRRPYSGTSPCTLRPFASASGPKNVCLPIFSGAVEETTFYTDAGCTAAYASPVALAKKTLCEDPLFILDRTLDANGCVTSEALLAPGAPATLPSLFSGGPVTCAPFDTGASDAFTPGAALPATETFGEPTVQSVGTGRIKASFLGTAADEALAAPFAYTDSTTNERCVPVLFDDGVARCVPSPAVQPKTVFSDAACTTPLVAFTPPVCGAATPPPVALAPPASPTCAAIATASAAFSLKPYVGLAFTKSGAQCVVFVLPPGAQLLENDQPIPLASLATVTLVTH